MVGTYGDALSWHNSNVGVHNNRHQRCITRNIQDVLFTSHTHIDLCQNSIQSDIYGHWSNFVNESFTLLEELIGFLMLRSCVAWNQWKKNGMKRPRFRKMEGSKRIKSRCCKKQRKIKKKSDNCYLKVKNNFYCLNRKKRVNEPIGKCF